MQSFVIFYRVITWVLAVGSVLTLMACKDANVAYWEHAAAINREYEPHAEEIVQRFISLKNKPNLNGLVQTSESAVELLQEITEELNELSDTDIDPDIVDFVVKERDFFQRVLILTQDYHTYFNAHLFMKSGDLPTPAQVNHRMGTGRMELRKLLKLAETLRAEAARLKSTKETQYNTALPELFFQIPNIKPLLQNR